MNAPSGTFTTLFELGDIRAQVLVRDLAERKNVSFADYANDHEGDFDPKLFSMVLTKVLPLALTHWAEQLRQKPDSKTEIDLHWGRTFDKLVSAHATHILDKNTIRFCQREVFNAVSEKGLDYQDKFDQMYSKAREFLADYQGGRLLSHMDRFLVEHGCTVALEHLTQDPGKQTLHACLVVGRLAVNYHKHHQALTHNPVFREIIKRAGDLSAAWDSISNVQELDYKNRDENVARWKTEPHMFFFEANPGRNAGLVLFFVEHDLLVYPEAVEVIKSAYPDLEETKKVVALIERKNIQHELNQTPHPNLTKKDRKL